MFAHTSLRLLAVLAIATVGGMPAASLARGPGTNCPDSATLGGSPMQVLSFTQLAPGTTQLTPATSAATNTDLDGMAGVGVNKTVAWSTTSGTIAARLRHRVFDSATSAEVCSCTYQVEVLAPSANGTAVCAIVVSNFIYPKTAPLYGAYRTDGSPKGQVKSTTVARAAGKGRTIRFALENCVVPGQLSKPVTLVFAANQILKDGKVYLEDQDGELSPAIKVYNPYVP
ncbi:hypothetical protein KAK07_01650 [Ideonella sp. 4Y16]|uniref:hypothetical protein n=1 Tax=Ideonella alba TaxID=2824118 RepID=UPI001B370A81|nr:hypothetical protein [Ideonella alba]MBQ0942031.1 hypothetical protein [Ideonella alba]